MSRSTQIEDITNQQSFSSEGREKTEDFLKASSAEICSVSTKSNARLNEEYASPDIETAHRNQNLTKRTQTYPSSRSQSYRAKPDVKIDTSTSAIKRRIKYKEPCSSCSKESSYAKHCKSPKVPASNLLRQNGLRRNLRNKLKKSMRTYMKRYMKRYMRKHMKKLDTTSKLQPVA